MIACQESAERNTFFDEFIYAVLNCYYNDSPAPKSRGLSHCVQRKHEVVHKILQVKSARQNKDAHLRKRCLIKITDLIDVPGIVPSPAEISRFMTASHDSVFNTKLI